MARDKAKPSNLVDPALKKQFIEMRDHWKGLNDRATSAAGKRTQYQAEIKKAGFKMQMIKDSILLMTPEGEADFKADMANRMLAAAYSNADIGDQLSLFLDPDRTPAIDRAAKEGQTAAMENKAHVPPYDPSTDQYKAWSTAFYAEQSRQVLGGIKKKEDGDKKGGKGAKGKDAAPANGNRRGRPPGSGKKGPNADPPAGSERTLIPKAEKDAQQARRNPPKDDAPPRRPAATPVTRASAAASRASAREEAESYFTKNSEPQGNA